MLRYKKHCFASSEEDTTRCRGYVKKGELDKQCQKCPFYINRDPKNHMVTQQNNK